MAKAPMMVVKSAVKEYLKGKKMMSSGELADAISQKVAGMLDDAVERTKSNKRSTVRGTDL